MIDRTCQRQQRVATQFAGKRIGELAIDPIEHADFFLLGVAERRRLGAFLDALRGRLAERNRLAAQQFLADARIEQRAQKHIARYAGEAFQIGNSHRD